MSSLQKIKRNPTNISFKHLKFWGGLFAQLFPYNQGANPNPHPNYIRPLDYEGCCHTTHIHNYLLTPHYPSTWKDGGGGA